MLKLEKSATLGRLIRLDDIPDLGKSTWSVVREAIQAGKTDEALKYLDYLQSETKPMHDSIVSFVDEVITFLSQFGEDNVYQVLRKRYAPTSKAWLATTPGPLESFQRCAEFQRAHGGKLAVREEPDRYVAVCDPCGSGGQVRRVKDVGTTSKAYPWSWGRSGVPYYCTHCAVLWEIVPIELRGYPIRVNLPGVKASDPCVHYYYKDPAQIPEEYFTRVGARKPR